jgi:hypothetical protein
MSTIFSCGAIGADTNIFSIFQITKIPYRKPRKQTFNFFITFNILYDVIRFVVS